MGYIIRLQKVADPIVSIDEPLYNLVGGFNHLEKYEFINGEDDIPCMKWKGIIHSMVPVTTNQMM